MVTPQWQLNPAYYLTRWITMDNCCVLDIFTGHLKYFQVRLPPYCAPIEELAEGPPTPKKRPIIDAIPAPDNGPPNPPEPPPSVGLPPPKPAASVASIATTASGSEVTLMEESISAYCEPFGKALPPVMNNANVDDSVASNGFKSSTPMRNGEQG